MAIYLKKFETMSQYNTYTADTENFILPNVSLTVDNNTVHYNPSTPPTPSHDFVEIGGIKWATMNIGANSVTDYGLYFQWGDTQGWTSEKACCEGTGSGSGDGGGEPVVCDEGTKCFNFSDYKWTTDDGLTFTKYNSTDGIITLEEGDDAVTAAWGGQWRMPTTAEFQALGNAVNTAWTSSYNSSGVAGLVLTDKTDSSKVLFFPACGNCFDGSVYEVGSLGSYWSSSLLSGTVQNAYYLDFYDGDVHWQTNYNRYDGFPVRGVLDE